MSDLPNPTMPLSPVTLPRGHFTAHAARKVWATVQRRTAVWRWPGRGISMKSVKRSG